MSDPETTQIGLWIGIVSVVIALVAAAWSRVSAKAAERSADAATRSAAAAERSVELRELELARAERERAVGQLAASWARGWSLDSTRAAIALTPMHLLPQFRELVHEACAINRAAPKKSADDIIQSHLKDDPELAKLCTRWG